MIPAYSKKVEIPEIKKDPRESLEQQLSRLEEQVRVLTQTVDYLTREKTRMKTDVQALASAVARK